MNEVRLLAAGVLLWTTLWTLLAVAQPALPQVGNIEETASTMRQNLAAPLASAVAQRLGTAPERVELHSLDGLRLRSDVAEVRFHGLLHDASGPRALLAVNAELDRRTLAPRQFDVEMLDEPNSGSFIPLANIDD